MKLCFHTIWELGPKYIGGTERFLINMCKELKILGHDPFIVCSNKNEELDVEGIKVLGRFTDRYSKNIDHYPFFSSKFIKQEIIGETFSVASLKRLSDYTNEQLSGINADLFHLNSFVSASFLTPHENYVITNHENRREYDWYWGKGFYDFFKTEVSERRTTLHEFKHLYTPSRHYAAEFSKELGLNVQAINLGVPLSNFMIEEKDDELKRKYSFDHDDVVILLPSRFQPFQKGHDIALQACSILKQCGIRFKIIFTGVKKSSEKYMSDFDKWVLNHNLQGYVKVITFPEIQEAYRNADIVISPERYCSYGLSISESLALGIPTVLSDIPSYKEIAGGFRHALFFKNESAQDLADKLLTVINSIDRNATEAIRFRTKFDLRDCAKKYSSIYLEILNVQSK